MERVTQEALYDHFFPGWRDVPEVNGERRLKCPLHDDIHPSFRLKISNRCWYCDPCGVGGGAWDLALKVLGEDRARALLRELDQLSSTSPPPRKGVSSIPPGRSAHVHTLPDPRVSTGTSGLTLQQYADAIGCTRQFLAGLGLCDDKRQGLPAVRIPYLGREGEELARRWRLALEKPLSGEDRRFRWRKGDKLQPYGLWKLDEAQKAGSVVILEGESDTHVLWFLGFSALGIPGAGNYNEKWDEHLKDIPRLYAVMEPDKAGELFVEKLARTLGDRLYVVVMPGGLKDPRALYLNDRERFKERFRRALEAARPYSAIKAERDDTRRTELWASCRTLAERPNILQDLRALLPLLGVVGEVSYALILYLALTSRLLKRPVSVAGKGPSAAGKSFVLERELSLFPSSAYYTLTAMSEHALAYSEESLEHRMLILYEATGMESDFQSYLIRSLLSEGQLRYETVIKDGGELKAKLIVRKGPTGLLVTTTAIRLHPENETRLLSVATDDSQTQTARVLIATALDDGEESGVDTQRWKDLQSWLELGPRAVSVPFAEALAELIPPVAVRLRRDFAQVLALIRAHALLHQPNRERDDKGRVLATLADYEAVRELVAPIIAEAVGATVSETMRETVQAVARLLEGGAECVSVATLAAQLELDSSAASRRAAAARAQGYLTNLETRRRQRARYVLGDPLPEDHVLLPEVGALEAVCACAVTPEGIEHSSDLGPETGAESVTGAAAGTDSQSGVPSCTRDGDNAAWRRLELKPVDGVVVWLLPGSNGSGRRWRLQREGEVLAETEVEDHARAAVWLDSLKKGELPAEIAPPPEDPEADPEPEQEIFL